MGFSYPIYGVSHGAIEFNPILGHSYPMKNRAPDMKVRLESDLRQKIEAAAEKNGRTLNAEIADRLERSFSTSGVNWIRLAKNSVPVEDFSSRLDALETKVALLLKDRATR